MVEGSDHAHRQTWPQWRRRHQYRASQARRRWNAYADAARDYSELQQP